MVGGDFGIIFPVLFPWLTIVSSDFPTLFPAVTIRDELRGGCYFSFVGKEREGGAGGGLDCVIVTLNECTILVVIFDRLVSPFFFSLQNLICV